MILEVDLGKNRRLVLHQSDEPTDASPIKLEVREKSRVEDKLLTELSLNRRHALLVSRVLGMMGSETP